MGFPCVYLYLTALFMHSTSFFLLYFAAVLKSIFKSLVLIEHKHMGLKLTHAKALPWVSRDVHLRTPQERCHYKKRLDRFGRAFEICRCRSGQKTIQIIATQSVYFVVFWFSCLNLHADFRCFFCRIRIVTENGFVL